MEESGAHSNSEDPNVSTNVQIKNNPTDKAENEKIANVTPSVSASAESAERIDCQKALPCDSSDKSIKKKAVLLNAPNIETICDDITATTEDIKRLKHVQVRSNSTGKLYQSSRRVSFPENDSELVTGYLEPADPWACG